MRQPGVGSATNANVKPFDTPFLLTSVAPRWLLCPPSLESAERNGRTLATWMNPVGMESQDTREFHNMYIYVYIYLHIYIYMVQACNPPSPPRWGWFLGLGVLPPWNPTIMQGTSASLPPPVGWVGCSMYVPT